MSEDSKKTREELLEPKFNEDHAREKMVRSMLVEKPVISRPGHCPLLDTVKSFLPKMAEAEKRLNEAVVTEGELVLLIG